MVSMHKHRVACYRIMNLINSINNSNKFLRNYRIIQFSRGNILASKIDSIRPVFLFLSKNYTNGCIEGICGNVKRQWPIWPSSNRSCCNFAFRASKACLHWPVQWKSASLESNVNNRDAILVQFAMKWLATTISSRWRDISLRGRCICNSSRVHSYKSRLLSTSAISRSLSYRVISSYIFWPRWTRSIISIPGSSC